VLILLGTADTSCTVGDAGVLSGYVTFTSNCEGDPVEGATFATPQFWKRGEAEQTTVPEVGAVMVYAFGGTT
jgi:hypothetical protein